MPTGRQRKLLGEKYVINLNNKGGVRKSPILGPFHKCMGKGLRKNIKTGTGNLEANRDAFGKVFTECQSKKVGTHRTKGDGKGVRAYYAGGGK